MVEPEDKKALGDSPAEEPTVVKLQLKASKRRTQVLLGVLTAIPIISLVVVVLAVVVRKKDDLDASVGGSVDRRLGLGLLQRPRTWNRKDAQGSTKNLFDILLHSTVTAQHVTNQAKSTGGACPSPQLWIRILMLKIDSMRLQTPRRWVSFSFLTSYGLLLVPSLRFLRFPLPPTSAHIGSSYCTFPFVRDVFPLICPPISIFHMCSSFFSPPIFCALLLTSTSSTHSLFLAVCPFSQSCF